MIFAFAIKEFFGWLKSRKNGNGNGYEVLGKKIDNLTTNHMHSADEKLDALLEKSIEQLLILRDIKESLKNRKQ